MTGSPRSTRERAAGASWPSRLAGELLQDLRFAARGLRRDRTFTLVAALTIAIGVGATTAVLSIADRVLLRTPPVPDPEQLVSVWELRMGSVTEGMEGRILPYARYEAYAEATTDVFDGLAGHRYAHFALSMDAGAAAVDGFLTSGNYFEVLGLEPALGRFYGEDDEAAVVLSHRVWRGRFNSASSVIGQPVSIDSRTFTVIGVAPPDFGGTMGVFTGDIWIPAVTYARLAPTGSAPAPFGVTPIGRLADGVPAAAAQERVDATARQIPPELPHVQVRGARLDPVTWRADLVGVLRTGLLVLGTAAVLLLLIASANITGMLVARSFARHREITVRLALGAGRARIIRQLVTESLLLFSIGGIGGVLLAFWGTRVLSGMRFPVDATMVVDATPDLPLLIAGLTGAAMTGILFGLWPALRTSRVDLTTSLKSFGRTPRRGALQSVFVAGQLAISTLLLVTAGLFARSFAQLSDVELGFEPRDVLVSTVNLGPHGYDAPRARVFFDRLLERVSELPGVESAALARFVPLGGSNASDDAAAVERPDDVVSGDYNAVNGGFFATMRVPLVAGRGFSGADREGAQPVVVINQRLAQQLWPDGGALGSLLRTRGEDHEVVGIVQDGTYAFVAETPRGLVYHPFEQDFHALMSLHVRSRVAQRELEESIRRIVSELDPNVAVEAARAMPDVVAFNTFAQRFAAGMTSLFAVIGLLLAALGVYGLLASHVAQRYREFGIRMAIGARAGDVLRLVLGHGARLAVVGCLLGLLLAVAAGRVVASLLFGIGAFDRITFASVPAVLIAVALLASMVPALRATRSDLVEALRQE